jgi:hypothetical protein
MGTVNLMVADERKSMRRVEAAVRRPRQRRCAGGSADPALCFLRDLYAINLRRSFWMVQTVFS